MIEYLCEHDGAIPKILLELMRPLPARVKLRNVKHHLWRQR